MDELADRRVRMVVEQIRRRGVTDERVLAAMERVPRHEFIHGPQRSQAYQDHPVPIGEAQTISQPYMVAVMTELLELTGEERVLEIGTGSGYQTAILAECAKEVVTIERFPRLGARARTTLVSLGFGNVLYRICDGTKGWPEHAPYDAIIITAAAPEPPRTILDQLGDPGIMVMPLGPRGLQDLTTIRRTEGRDVKKVHFKCAFVPLVGMEGFPN